MPSGGPRARSGPPPDPNALRRDRDSAEWIHLAARREGDPPKWPLSRPGVREMQLWASEWTRPQAVEWERLGLAVEVAMFVRDLIRAEHKNASASDRALVLRHLDSLGISVGGLRQHRWILDGQADDVRDAANHDADRGATAKTRFKTIAGGRTA